MKYLHFLFLFGFSANAFAECYGTDTLKTCYDDSGNTYTVQQFGNMTAVQGYNSNTGSNWSQSSTKLGSSTYTDGIDADGNSWNSTTNSIGDSTFTTGVDSDGNIFSTICNGVNCY